MSASHRMFRTASSLATTAALAALGVSCGPDGRPGSAPVPAENVLAVAASGSQSQAPALPAGLRAAYIASVQAGAAEAYRAVRSDAGGWIAPNPAQAFSASLGPDGARIDPAAGGPSWRFSVGLTGYGCEDHLGPAPPASPQASHNRIEYHRDSLSEWYVNGPLGLEQGFTLSAPPPCRTEGGGRIAIELGLGGSLLPALTAGADTVELKDRSGAVRLRYTDLHSHDAAGKPLAARMALHERRLALYVDDSTAAYPIVIDPLMWTEQAKLVASDGGIDDGFGYAAGISGDSAVIGVYFAAAAYVFVQNGTAWTEQQKLIPSGLSGGFGRAVAISGDTILIGAANTQTMNGGMNAGAAYVFTRAGGMWTQEQELSASDGSAGAELGSSVALSGDTAVVGARYEGAMAPTAGAAYVFVRAGTTWTEEQKLVASDPMAGALFGRSVAIDGDTVVVGSNAEDGSGYGSAYLFFRSGAMWTEEQKVGASDLVMNDGFGRSVAISVDTALIGAPLQDGMAGTNAGSAYVFERSGGMWTEQQKLTPADASMFGSFGSSVAVAGDSAVVGANGLGPGSAYWFTRSAGMWTEQQKFAPMPSSDSFGDAMAMDGKWVAVGASLDATMVGPGAGAAYVFALQGTDGEACAAASECLSGFCVDGLCCDTACGGGDPNDCQACSAAEGAMTDGVCSLLAANSICRNNAGDCDVAETCDGTSPDCPADALAPDGTACTGGLCMGGMCMPDSGSGGNGGSGGSGTGTGGGTATGTGTGTGGASGEPTDEGGCGCRIAGAPMGGQAGAGWFGALGILLAARRRRRAMPGRPVRA